MIQRYQDEQWARYDAQQQALADARAALAREVADVRARQVAAKGAARRHEAELAMEERERLQEEVERVSALEADARSAAAAGELRRKLDLRAKVPPRLPSSISCMHACIGLPASGPGSRAVSCERGVSGCKRAVVWMGRRGAIRWLLGTLRSWTRAGWDPAARRGPQSRATCGPLFAWPR